ncbi:HAMP domain-containing sensor histidine kinase [Nocardioides piscis]|uniref:histidine kinase n=1 Tax=Nocardioides piscis TaxID=2714938 RepID=A0A6G7YBF3_9ACTN|nr:HAMP domain-containing sensor histidine kinase [Nocardioides piscis]QIK74123.1 HAMP domain-containing histidine kinase [Nocardioides piscis]
MRLRFTLAFMFIALVVAGVTGTVRAGVLSDDNRADELEDLTRHARVIGGVAEILAVDAKTVQVDELAPFVPDYTEASVQWPDASTITIAGSEFDRRNVGTADDLLFVRETVGGTTVSLVEEAHVVVDQTRRQQTSLFALLVLVVLLSGVVGLFIAGWLARPFGQLAAAACDLGRGRFDIDPPNSTIPEISSMSTSLKASATRLQDSLHRDREFFHHASHVLRTPLTGIRLELDDMLSRDDLGDDVRHTATRCLRDVERLDATVAELLSFARGRALVAGAEVPLLTFSAQVAQRWRDRLPESREVRALVDEGPECFLTPGPVEQLLDSVLSDVSAHGTGAVSLRFGGQDDYLRISVVCDGRREGAPPDTDIALARSIIEALGGRCVGDATDGGLEILLPRR